MVARARPVTDQPSNGQLRPALAKSAESICQVAPASMMVMSAGPPTSSRPSPRLSRPTSRAGLTVIIASKAGQSRTPSSTRARTYRGSAHSRPTIPKDAAAKLVVFVAAGCGA